MNPHYRRLRFPFACLLLASLMSITNLGCDQIVTRRAMPAPLREPVEITLTGRVGRVYGGDSFEFRSGKETHFLLLLGAGAPGPGEPFYHQSLKATRNLLRGKQLTVHVVGRDEVMREFVEVTVPVGKTEGEFESDEFDLGIELTKRGWARYNGASFDGAERLIEAEAYAKKRKVGVWAESKLTLKKALKKKSNDR